jgi:hypothetical protein
MLLPRPTSLPLPATQDVASDEPSFGPMFIISFASMMNPSASALTQQGAGTSYWPPAAGVTTTVQSQLVNVKPQENKAGWQVGAWVGGWVASWDCS